MMTTLRIYAAFMLLSFLAGTASFAQTLPVPSHVVILIEENYSYAQIIGSSAAAYAPNINALCADTNAAVFTQSYAIAHPSEPNYLDFFSGSNQGVTNDGVPSSYPFTTDNLGAELIGASKTFVTYSEDLPSVGFDGASYTLGGRNYARKHNPCTNWVGTGTNQFPNTVNQPFTSFPWAANYSSLPTVCYVVPNMTNDMHDGSYPTNITIGDTWMLTHMDSLRKWSLLNNTLYIIIFDEDDDLHSNNIPTIFYGPMVKGGTYSEHITLYNVLRTIEQMYGLSYAGNASTVTAITDCWRTSINNGVANVGAGYEFKVMPNPASDEITFACNNLQNGRLTINITDQLGRLINTSNMNGTELKINTSSFAAGLYYYKVLNENNSVSEGKFVVSHN